MDIGITYILESVCGKNPGDDTNFTDSVMEAHRMRKKKYALIFRCCWYRNNLNVS